MRHAMRFMLLGAIAAVHAAAAWAANGDILERKAIATAADATFAVERIVYESDGLRIVGFLAYPKGAAEGAARLPCVLFNRGGNRDYGAHTPENFLNRARRITAWGYVLFASNYRGSPGSEGQDEFGGRDVDDVHNAIRVFDNLAFADPDRIGMWGHSRGGMMTYIALTKTDRIRAAVIGAGVADLERMIALRPEMDTGVAGRSSPTGSRTARRRSRRGRLSVSSIGCLPKRRSCSSTAPRTGASIRAIRWTWPLRSSQRGNRSACC